MKWLKDFNSTLSGVERREGVVSVKKQGCAAESAVVLFRLHAQGLEPFSRAS